MKNVKKELSAKKDVKPQSKLGAYMNNNNNQNQKLSCGCKKGCSGCQSGKCQCSGSRSAEKGKGGDILPCGCKKGDCDCKE